MASNRSLASINDASAVVPLSYQKIDPSTGSPFTNSQVTAVSLTIYNAADGSTLLASAGMTWNATLQAYVSSWTPSGAALTARRAVAVMVPTRAVGVAAALTPTTFEWMDMADVLYRIDAAKSAILSEVDSKAAEIEGAGYVQGTDSLRQAKLQRDSMANQIGALDLRQSTNFLSPGFMAQSNTYTIYLRVRDDNGTLVDADATPALTLLEGSVTGVTISAFTRDGVGLYHATVTLSGSAVPKTVFTLRAAWNRTEGSIVNSEEALRTVTIDSFETDTGQILSNTQTILNLLNNGTYGLSAIQAIVSDIQSKVNNGTYGLSALRTDIDAVAAQVGIDNNASIQAKLGAFTAVLNLFSLLGAFTPSETVLKALQTIQGTLY